MALEVMARAAAPIPLDIAFRVEPGELLALVGHSGAGKTTLHAHHRRAVVPAGGAGAGERRPHGSIPRAGIALRRDQRRVGVVFQNYALFPHMTAAQNVASAIDHLPRSDRAAEAGRLLELVNLHGLGARKPAHLSSGQQQRVAVARALARRPEALLLDEPFSAVDRATRDRLYGEIIGLRAHLAMPVVLVTHDITEAQLLADRMVVIDAGRMVAEGPTGAVMADPVALHAMGIRDVAAMLPASMSNGR